MNASQHIARFRAWWNAVEANALPLDSIPTWKVEEMIREAWLDGHKRGISDLADVMKEQQELSDRRAQAWKA